MKKKLLALVTASFAASTAAQAAAVDFSSVTTKISEEMTGALTTLLAIVALMVPIIALFFIYRRAKGIVK